MSQVITIRIEVPDGTLVRVLGNEVPDDFEHEPLPVETYAAEEHFDGPVNGAPVQRTMATQQPAVTWQVGQVHQQGHKPLKTNRRGLFCPTPVGKDQNGSTLFCQWRP